jgi:hypothetical protein
MKNMSMLEKRNLQTTSHRAEYWKKLEIKPKYNVVPLLLRANHSEILDSRKHWFGMPVLLKSLGLEQKAGMWHLPSPAFHRTLFWKSEKTVLPDKIHDVIIFGGDTGEYTGIRYSNIFHHYKGYLYCGDLVLCEYDTRQLSDLVINFQP